MQTIEMNGPGDASVLVLGEQDAPTPAAGEVLIEVAFAGINRPDVFQRMGAYPPPPGASATLGLEVSGRIAALGSGVTQWHVGDRVCALTNGGGYAERVCVDARHCLLVPAAVSLRGAAALPETLFTVWSNVFERARLVAGETFLVHAGASGIGTAAIQMAKAMGAQVLTTASSSEKCEACVSLGADLAINYQSDDFVEQVMVATEGKGVDVILDMVGGDYMARNIDCAALDGRIVNIAFLRGPVAELNMMPVMLKRLSLSGSTLRPQSADAKAAMADGLREHIWPQVADGRIKALLHPASFTLGQAADAHRLMESNQVVGKLVLDVNPALESAQRAQP